MDPIERWLSRLRPVGPVSATTEITGRYGWAVRPWRLAGEFHLALARLDRDFAADRHGRKGGLLVHALVVEVGEHLPPGMLLLALLNLGRSLATLDTGGEAERLGRYLDLCKQTRSVSSSGLDIDSLAALPPQFLNLMLEAVIEPSHGELPLPGVSPRELTEVMATAIQVLPPRLGLGLRWGVRVASAENQLRLVSTSPPAFPSLSGVKNRFHEWLEEQLAAGNRGAIGALAGNWGIRSSTDLWRELDTPEMA